MGEDKNAIRVEDYKEEDIIGRSKFGDVFKVKKLSNGKYYAAKILIFIHFDDENQRINFKRELYCYQNLDNPAVVKYIGYSPFGFGEDSILYITKYMENGCLSRLFDSIRKKRTPNGWNNTKMIINILGISLGIKYLHESGIIFGDPRPSNILLDKRYYPKLTDIGLSKYEYCMRACMIECPYYTAPEKIENEYYTYKSDVFSFGMILYEFYANSPPKINGRSKMIIYKNIIKGERPNEKKIVDGPVKTLIKKCWSYSVEERPTFDDIIHCYIDNREVFWPEDVDDDEVEQYLRKFGLSLDPDQNAEFFRKHPPIIEEKEEEEEEDL